LIRTSRYTLINRLADVFAQAAHIRDFNLERADDEAVWNFASQHDFVIVSKDSDFRQRSFLRGAPPKIIWLNVGNCPTSRIEEVIRQFSAQIDAFVKDDSTSFLELR